MKRNLAILFSLLVSTNALASAQSGASIAVSGVIPEVFSVQTELAAITSFAVTSAEKVARQPLGQLSLSYNAPLATLSVASSTWSGKPEAKGRAFGDFTLAFGKCRALRAPSELRLSHQPTELALAPIRRSGVTESCEVLASWQADPETLPPAKYSMTVYVVMTSM